ncbi:MAG: hypothetical protein EZS28_032705 [Streblomastix strix]|uniref:Uncharacterized protein n=1 Tax=Streblomastix strix TaxID=222440 RepID=A0A5J4UMM0_9EUKA|nr:MAG: hypothetical protein EZS28_032705 [Streblomastix strix]
MTEAKKQLINVSRSSVDDVIMEHYEKFKQGIPIALVNQFKPSNWLLKTQRNAIVHKCEEQRKYILMMINEKDTETSNANYQKYKKTIEDDGFIEQVVQETKRSGRIEKQYIRDSFWDGTNLWTPVKKYCHNAIQAINEINGVVHL